LRDGVKAVAVLGVIPFSRWVNEAPVDLLGVDIAFVISSYLINSVVLSEIIAASRFYVTGL
jgi:peptidoglycan/LPS O-acetylase OafA/YrhL